MTSRKPGPLLAVDTTERELSVALQTGDGIVAIRRAPRKPHDETIHAAADHVLARAGISVKDISSVAVASGPGTFTGIRVGMAYAAMLALELRIPALAVSRLEALAFAASGGKILAAIDGFRGETFCQLFERKNTLPRPRGNPLWLRPEQWTDFKSAALSRGFVLSAGKPGARELLAPAASLLFRRRSPPFEPLYLKPANYEISRR
jgi:tRNA threonylcarbamoyladenosine biosynthesis protein TsaB